MKKLFLSTIQLLMSVLLVAGIARGQNPIGGLSVSSNQPAADAGLPSTTGSITRAGADAKNINARAVRNFNRQYKDASDVKWFNSGKTTVASFEEKGLKTMAVYLKNGSWLHTLINYDESRLAEPVKLLVNSQFRNYHITWVTEVHEGDKLMYFINIENDKRFKQVVVYNNEVGVIKSLAKIQ